MRRLWNTGLPGLSYHPPVGIIEITLVMLLAVDAVKAERNELMEMRQADVINDEVMRVLQADIDLEETLIVGATRHEL
jgi:hypothetical protein